MSDYEFWKDLGNIFDSILNYQKKNAEFNNRFINPWIRLGNIFDRDDQHKEAVQAYRLAIEIDPDSAQNWADLGDALFKMGAHADAVGAYQKAIALDPKAGWPVSNLGLTLVSLGRCEEAVQLFLESIGLLTENKDRAVSWNRLGNAYRKLNDYENAFLAFQQADELDAENTGFRDQLDETTESSTMVAPEEVIVQMSIDEPAEVRAPVVETITEVPQAGEVAVAEESSTSDVLPEAQDEPVAAIPEAEVRAAEISIASDDPAIVDEFATPDSVTNGLEAAPIPEETGKTEEVMEEEGESLPAWLEEETVEAEEDELVVDETQTEPESVEESVTQVVEEVVALSEVKVTEASAAVAPADAGAEAPVENALEKVEAEISVEAEKDDAAPAMEAAEEVAPVQIQAVVDESTTTTEMVDTYTEFTSTPVVDPSTLEDTQPIRAVRKRTIAAPVSEGQADEAATQPEQGGTADPQGTAPVSEETSTAAQSSAVEASTASVTGEAAYEEYLKDVAQPEDTLPDHLEAVHAGAPVTKVSQTGEVRIAMDTQNAHVWNELGNVYLNSGACDDAITAYGRAIELDRQFAWPYSNLALAYVQKGRFAEAILLYQRSIELFASDKDKAVTWNRLGNVYRRLNDYANAIAAYQTADDLDPDNATLSLRSHYGLLGNLYLDQKPNYVS